MRITYHKERYTRKESKEKATSIEEAEEVNNMKRIG